MHEHVSETREAVPEVADPLSTTSLNTIMFDHPPHLIGSTNLTSNCSNVKTKIFELGDQALQWTTTSKLDRLDCVLVGSSKVHR